MTQSTPSGTTLDAVDHATEGILGRLRAVDDDLRVRPSRLPDWTVGHVLAHLALNAEALARVAAALRAGERGVMYPLGPQGRARDIEELAAQPAAILHARLASSAERFHEQWTDPVPDGPFTPAPGGPEFEAASIPFRRLREVEAHGVDAGHGLVTPDDWSAHYVETDLPAQWNDVAARLPEGVGVDVVDDLGVHWTAGRGQIIEAAMRRPDLLAWVIDRGDPGPLPTLTSWA